MEFAPRVRAVLGPTNTGKTHLAIERMLAHSSGIIGFPLRLLARENYERMVKQKGEKSVALITGEEKIVPAGARWYACTTEAMPLDRHVEFVAIDEIQLCADPDRGHVFTDRLLHARGMVETMFLGAETIRPLLKRLVPSATVETRPRLSSLTYSGPVKLTRLPPRTAIVAFSAGEVYALAEALRRRRGGCAVVMGRLSPRTRNAQVALYQEGEVDFLVATDAIGMGLNMAVDHVAFAGLQKFDGNRPRRLQPPEVAQIAGRAGRGMRDGTFGTTADCPPMDDPLVQAVEDHNFDALEQLCWRNADLDFSGIDPLLATLTEPPPRPGLVRGNDASDLVTLQALAADPEIRAAARGRKQVRLLWEACQIPDFRKLTDETHAKLCARIFHSVAKDGALPVDWLASATANLDRADGDIDTLMHRLSGVRIWSYIAARADWVRDAPHWQGLTRAIEDRLSDALHARLTARFVDRRAAHLIRKLESGEENLLSAVTRRGEVLVEGHPVGSVAGFGFTADPTALGDDHRLVQRAARRALRAEMPRRVAAFAAAPDDAITLDGFRLLSWEGAPVARLRPGPSPLHPHAEPTHSDFLDGPERERVRARAQAWIDAWVARDLPGLLHTGAPAAVRGPLHRLAENLGVVMGVDREALGPTDRQTLKSAGIRAGRFALFAPAALKPRAAGLRAILWAIQSGVASPALPSPGTTSIPAASLRDWPEGFAAMMGWVEAGPVALRLDIAERIAGELAWETRRGGIVVPTNLASRLGVPSESVAPVLRGLGFRVDPAAALPPDMFGPPAPPRLSAVRRPHAPAKPALPATSGGPFAALANWRR